MPKRTAKGSKKSKMSRKEAIKKALSLPIVGDSIKRGDATIKDWLTVIYASEFFEDEEAFFDKHKNLKLKHNLNGS